MLKKYKTCSVPLGRACQHVNLMVTQFESVRTRWFLLPKKITNAFKRVNFSDAPTRVQTYDETSDASRRVYFSNAFTCVQIYYASRRVPRTRLDASDVSFWTRLNASSVAFRTHLKCVFKRVYTQYFLHGVGQHPTIIHHIPYPHPL